MTPELAVGARGDVRWRLVGATALVFLSVGCYIPVLPGYIVGKLHGSTEAVGIAIGATALAAFALRAEAGALGDRRGRRVPAIAGGLLLALGALLLLGPGAIVFVVLARMLIGAGDALFTTATMAWMVDGSAAERRGRDMALIGMGIWLGFALGPQWGVIVRDQLGYSGVWAVACAMALLALAVVGTLPAAPAAESASRGSRLPRGAIAPAVAMLLACYGNGVFDAFGVLHLTGRGLPNGAGFGGAASVFTVVAVVGFAGRFAGGALCDRMSPRIVAALGAALVALAYGTLAEARSFAVAAAGAAAMGLGLSLLYPALSLLVTRAVPVRERGAGIGVFFASLDTAFAVGPLLGGVIVSASSSAVALWSGAGVALLALPVIARSAGVVNDLPADHGDEDVAVPAGLGGGT